MTAGRRWARRALYGFCPCVEINRVSGKPLPVPGSVRLKTSPRLSIASSRLSINFEQTIAGRILTSNGYPTTGRYLPSRCKKESSMRVDLRLSPLSGTGLALHLPNAPMLGPVFAARNVCPYSISSLEEVCPNLR